MKLSLLLCKKQISDKSSKKTQKLEPKQNKIALAKKWLILVHNSFDNLKGYQTIFSSFIKFVNNLYLQQMGKKKNIRQAKRQIPLIEEVTTVAQIAKMAPVLLVPPPEAQVELEQELVIAVAAQLSQVVQVPPPQVPFHLFNQLMKKTSKFLVQRVNRTVENHKTFDEIYLKCLNKDQKPFQPKEENKVYVCKFCPLEFQSQKGYAGHIKVHLGRKKNKLQTKKNKKNQLQDELVKIEEVDVKEEEDSQQMVKIL